MDTRDFFERERPLAARQYDDEARTLEEMIRERPWVGTLLEAVVSMRGGRLTDHSCGVPRVLLGLEGHPGQFVDDLLDAMGEEHLRTAFLVARAANSIVTATEMDGEPVSLCRIWMPTGRKSRKRVRYFIASGGEDAKDLCREWIDWQPGEPGETWSYDILEFTAGEEFASFLKMMADDSSWNGNFLKPKTVDRMFFPRLLDK